MRKKKYTNFVTQVIARLNLTDYKLAAKLGLQPSTVWHWGSVEKIPTKYHAKILKIAKSLNVDVAAKDLQDYYYE